MNCYVIPIKLIYNAPIYIIAPNLRGQDAKGQFVFTLKQTNKHIFFFFTIDHGVKQCDVLTLGQTNQR